MDSLLKDLGLKRHNEVGKKVGNQIWFHLNYASDYMSNDSIVEILGKAQDLVPGFMPTVVRLDHKTGDISLIESCDFDSSDEPIVGRSLSLKIEGHKLTNPPKDPSIYHHKWMFVADDYKGFSVEDAKARSIAWKSHLGTNKDISSRIGRKSFWDAWIGEELPHLAQEFTSQNTSINSNKIPKGISVSVDREFIKSGFVNLDIGGGRYDNATSYLKEQGITNLVYDPFNRTPDHNQSVMEQVKPGVDSVGIHNVLNVIKEPVIRDSLIRMAYEYLKTNGVLCVSIYEGVGKDAKSGIGRKTGNDQWQNFLPKEAYIEAIQKVFGNVEIKYGLLIATKKE